MVVECSASLESRERRRPLIKVLGCVLQDQWRDPTMTDRGQVQHFIDAIPNPALCHGSSGKKSDQFETTGRSSLRSSSF